MIKKAPNRHIKHTVDIQALGAKLQQGASDLELELSSVQIEQLLAYLSLLVKWNAVYNLTSIHLPEDMLTHHLLDSLAVVSAIQDAENLLDVGSGGGLPGIVLAIIRPELLVSMIDVVQKKTAFLTQVKTELQLENVTVHTGRVENLELEKKFDVIISRAFASLPDFIRLSQHLLTNGGRFIAMKGILPIDEISSLEADWRVKEVQVLEVPMLDAQRHLIVLEKKLAK